MTDDSEVGVEVWFKNQMGDVFKKCIMTVIPQVGHIIHLNEDEGNVLKVGWNNYTDEFGKERWVVLIDVDTYFSGDQDGLYGDWS